MAYKLRKPVTNYKMILGVLLVVAILFLVYLSFRNYKVEKFFADSCKVKVVLVHASWCSHCVKYIEKGTFKQAREVILAKEEFADKVCFEDLEYDANKEKVDKLGVTGFPSIIAVNASGEKVLDFNSFREGPKPDRDNMQDIEDFTRAALKLVSK